MKTVLRCPEALEFVYKEAPDVFRVPSFIDQTLAVPIESIMVLLHCGAEQFLANLDWLKGDLSENVFYDASIEYVRAL